MEIASFIPELSKIGLTKDQASVYTCLLQKGSSPASRVALYTKLSRPLTYKLLDELIAYNIVTKEDSAGVVARFTAEHPLKLRELITQKRNELEQKNSALEDIMSSLVSEYTALSGKPGVRILTGIDGVAELYEDILNESEDIMLIRSPKDAEHPELQSLVTKQVDAQVASAIHTKAITPFTDETHEELETWDAPHLITRHLVSLEKLHIPAQIIIYADKVAITAYEDILITTIIENDAINTTFKMIFSFLWDVVADEDREIRNGLKEGTLTAPLPKQ